MHKDIPLIAVAGPTASGKSELALNIAAIFQGKIVNCDSLQVYRGFDIGTAKLPEAERRGIPHHLIGILDPHELFTAGEFARQTRLTIEEVSSRGNLPILAGGTGFYLRSLIHGLSPGPPGDPELRARLERRERRRPGSLHRILSRLDFQVAARIHSNDVRKTIRALEICMRTGQPASLAMEKERNALTGYRVLKIGLFPDREVLHRRIEQRTERMFKGGLMTEVESLIASGVSPEAKPFESLGYRQAQQVLRGELTLSQAIGLTIEKTRQYAKRQMTWFRREPDLVAVEGFGDDAKIIAEVLEMVRQVNA